MNAAPFQPHAWQLQAAVDYQRLGGVFIGLDPGAGKTYAFAQIARQCRRPLVVAPAAAIRQTMAQFESYGVACSLASEWVKAGPDAKWLGRTVLFASYTWLTRAEQSEFFERFAPSDVLMDEFHMARGLNNSARKRLERYLVARPEVRVGISTASPMSSHVHDFAFGLHWALRSGVRGLVPQLASGLDVLQERLDRSPEARECFRARLEATPGVYLDVGDVGRYQGEVVLRVVRQDPALALPPTWETPSGFLIESAAHAAVVEKQLAAGFYYDTVPRPTPNYCAARKVWGNVVRRCIDQGLADTEFQCRELRPEQYKMWHDNQLAEGPLAEPVPVWADYGVAEWVASYIAGTSEKPGTANTLRSAAASAARTGSPGSSATGLSRPDFSSAIRATIQRASTSTTCSSAQRPTTTPTATAKGVTPPGLGTAGGSAAPSLAPNGTVSSSADALPSTDSWRPLIIWVHHTALGRMLSETLGVPFYREHAMPESGGAALNEAREPIAIASISACFQGLNCQWFSRSLFLECPADPETWKQAVGRTARQGQTADQVQVDIVVNCPAAERALRTAIERASVVYETTGKRNPLLTIEKEW